jgi:hypothetical protein
VGRQEAVYSFSKDGRGATYALEGEKALVVRICVRRDLFSVTRDLLPRQKRPITVSKETHFSVKRDLLHVLGHSRFICIGEHADLFTGKYICQNRPITVSKETYSMTFYMYR